MGVDINQSFDKLRKYCEDEGFKGYDPYDGLNSTFFNSLPFVSKNRLVKLAWIQAFKRSPINLRSLMGVKKDFNPKALGLFLSGYSALYDIDKKPEYIERMSYLSEHLIRIANQQYSGACWGYNFDWQSRAFFQPKNMPTVVASTFIASALLDAYEITKEEVLLSTARSTCNFILKDLNRTYDEAGNFAFSYSPLDKSVVFNASLLGSRILSRVYSYTKEEHLIQEAKKSVQFCCNAQRKDGSWGYGTFPFHQWVDNFHTGYNLECIADYIRFSGDSTYRVNIDKGFEYYISTFFTEEGISKYYNNSTYPIDIHAPAQLIITLKKLDKFSENKELAKKVLEWTITHMQSEKGYFYYQINKYFSSRISYMRWAQAWMFYSLSTYLKLDANERN